MSSERVDSSGIGPRPKPSPGPNASPRSHAGDNSKVHPDFGSVGSATHANLHDALGKLPKGTWKKYYDDIYDELNESDVKSPKAMAESINLSTKYALSGGFTKDKALAGYMARGVHADAIKAYRKAMAEDARSQNKTKKGSK